MICDVLDGFWMMIKWFWIFTIFCAELIAAWSLNNFLMSGPKVNLVFSESVASGVYTGVRECQYQFQWDRWNCPEHSHPLFTEKSPPGANKETSFIHAITSAGIMYMLTKNCSLGHFDKCGCDETKKGYSHSVRSTWKWGGCSDNVRFGEKIAKQYVDRMESGNDARATMNLHNYDVGRRAIKRTMKLKCKCHGVSGACTTKTCWQHLAEFRTVGFYLKRRYHRSRILNLQDGQLNLGNFQSHLQTMKISNYELLYLEDSPNYCYQNTTLGLPGTLDRICIRPDKGEKMPKWQRKSCKRLCTECGLTVKKKEVLRVVSCNCKFHWCCAVRCQSCERNVVNHFCSGKKKREKLTPKIRKHYRIQISAGIMRPDMTRVT